MNHLLLYFLFYEVSVYFNMFRDHDELDSLQYLLMIGCQLEWNFHLIIVLGYAQSKYLHKFREP